MKEVYLVVIQDLDGQIKNVQCDTMADLGKLVNNIDTAEYTILSVTTIQGYTNSWADYCSKPKNLERG